MRLRHTDRLHGYMLGTVFTSHSFMDADRRYETLRSETKDFITQATSILCLYQYSIFRVVVNTTSKK